MKQEEIQLAFSNNIQKIELAFDFSNYIKQADTALKATSVGAERLNKASVAFVEAKKVLFQYEKVADGYLKGVDAYYKNYDKTAKDLGIDTKTTQFYKEYLSVIQTIGQISDNIAQMKIASNVK